MQQNRTTAIKYCQMYIEKTIVSNKTQFLSAVHIRIGIYKNVIIRDGIYTRLIS